MIEGNTYYLNENDNIKDKFHTIKGELVLLDLDLAPIYGYEVKKFNQQIKRNFDRFPSDFMFQLTKEESDSILRCQFGTSSWGGTRYLPYAFTEQGVYMLATVLKGELAVKQSIFIIRAFKSLKDYIQENRYLLTNEERDTLLLSHSEKIDNISKQIDEINQNFITDKVKQICILNNQKFEADVAYIQIIKEAKSSIYLIDDYIGAHTLELLSNKNKNVEVIIFSDNKAKDKSMPLLISSFSKQYPPLTIKPNNKLFHDRYFILDYKTNNQKIYHLGASIKDGGKITIHQPSWWFLTFGHSPTQQPPL